MRDIKFRAWDKENKKMVYSDEVFPKSCYKFEFDCFNDYEFRLMKMIDRYNVIDDEGNETYQEVFKSVDADIMQYIGANDTFDNEIYEGDIIKRINLTPMELLYGREEIGVVEYVNAQFILKIDKDSYYEISSDGVFYINIADYEVIGNIYENPDLLGD